MESSLKADSGEIVRLKTVTETTEPLITAAAATLDPHRPQNHEAIATEPHTQSHQAAEDTRLIPARPVTPFSAMKASAEFIKEKDGNVSLSKAPHQRLVSG